MDIIMIGAPSRKRDNLLSMLESIDLPLTIRSVESCKGAIEIINQNKPETVFIDCRDPEPENEKEIGKLILNQAVNFVVLLVSRKGLRSHFTHYSSCELIYDEVTIEVLSNLLINI